MSQDPTQDDRRDYTPMIKTTLVFIGIVIVIMVISNIKDSINNKVDLTIDAPVSGATVRGDSIIVSGKLDQEDAELYLADGTVIPVKNSRFSFNYPIPEPINIIELKVDRNNGFRLKKEIIVNRTFSPKEEAERQAKIKKAKALKESELAKIAKEERAAELKWERSKAGKIHKKHPEWSKEDCIRLADGRIWIGMHINMLKYNRGLPDAANPSNYGNGTQWQWCWHEWTPGCFYDDNEDGLIDSYN